MSRRIRLAVFLAATAAAVSHAQNVHNVGGVASRATMIVSGGAYKGCGLRFVGVALSDPVMFPVFGWDFNLSLARFDGTAIAVILKTEVTRMRDMQELRGGSGGMRKVKTTWVQPEGKDAWTPFKSGISGENGLSSMTTYRTDGILEYMAEAAAGSAGPLLLGVELDSERVTRIYRFTPQVGEQDAATFFACVRTMLDQAEKDALKR